MIPARLRASVATSKLSCFLPILRTWIRQTIAASLPRLRGQISSGFRYLATGDTEIDRWETISRLFGNQLAADVMAAAHHGAKSGTYPKAVANVGPNTILISAGVESQYDHPHGAAILVYQALAKHVWATNAGGNAHNLLTRRNGSDFDTTIFPHASVTA